MMRKKRQVSLLACCLWLGGTCLLLAAETAPAVFWTTGKNLMPQWGFYPLGQAYGDTEPLDGHAAWTAGGTAALTWVAEFPAAGEYHFWVRRFGGGQATVTVNELPLEPGRGGPGGGRYVWRHEGVRPLTAGRHHIDITVARSMFDAILISSDADFRPEGANLPEPVREPIRRATRGYRCDRHLEQAAGGRPFVLGRLPRYEEVFCDWVPASEDVLEDRLQLWGAANQHLTGTFGIRALQDIPSLEVRLAELTGPDGTLIERANLDLRVVTVRERIQVLFAEHGAWNRRRGEAAEMLLRDSRTGQPPAGPQGGFGGGWCATAIPARQTRQIWLTLDMPADCQPGVYHGQLLLTAGDSHAALNLEVELLPLDLKPVEGYFSIYHPLNPVNQESPHFVCEARYRAELEDMVRHGLNTVTLYGGIETLSLAREAGMTAAPCLMRWPDGRANAELEQARAMGFEGLLYYGVDEPRSEEAIERCLREGQRRRERDLTMMAAINSHQAWEPLRDVLTHPVLVIYHFGGRNNPAVLYAREQGSLPISYWMTNVSYPLWYRGLAGLYNRACGYLGTAPWAYTDFADADRKHDPDVLSHQVTYPDEDGLPIPTLQWAAFRAGIDDVRYLQALDRAIEAGAAKLGEESAPEGLREAVETARAIRAERFESLGGRWFEYLCQTEMATLEETRHEFAQAIVRINQRLP